ncbi:DUF4112 domain-containing protein [Roseisalinus antarcticus]|uniref:DUF4112 domain-containing protein n=1 Tax=Roseisalinus antarcticus TaxID=254357 RepID=A0A1Y5TZN8_9RHOB|nr:DUF4112 domain-containing protein [Roseisalinus antarcticus]SLN76875.1 hypothetical protein ROA7023_04261 [Roseisalinus antarcticus]
MTVLDHDERRTAAQLHDAPAEIATEIARLERLAHTLDARFRIPFTSFHIGADGLLGLIPGVGDTLAALPSAYMITRGAQLGARKRTLVRMGGNAGIDWIIGAIPLVGDIFDIGFKGNLRNAALLREDLLRQHGGASRAVA